MRELCKYIPIGPIVLGVLVFILIPFDETQAFSETYQQQVSTRADTA